MIARRSPRRTDSSFRKLAAYVTGKASHIWTANCCEDPEIAVIEIEATQSLNVRTRADRTYHLIVSFPEGERPDLETLKEVERTLSNRLGYSEHQRLVAVHTDTRHLHLHVAISRINPMTFNNVEPFRDYSTLFKACRDIEQTHHLVKLQTGVAAAPYCAMEARQGLVSFEKWLRARPDLSTSIKSAGSWDDLHEALGRIDVDIRKRGAGLVIAHKRMALFCKASSVDRSLSLTSLESRLGPYQQASRDILAETSYKPLPSVVSEAASDLFRTYQAAKALNSKQKRNRMDAIRDHHAADLRKISEEYRQRRIAITKDRLLHPARKTDIYLALSVGMTRDMDELRKRSKAERDIIRKNHPSKPWVQWLHEQAEQGSTVALGTLRKTRWNQQEVSENAIQLDEVKHKIIEGISRKILNDGTIEYRLQHGRVRDHGGWLSIPDHIGNQISEALDFISAHFGDEMKAHGSTDFLKAVSKQSKEKNPSLSRVDTSKNIER